MKTWAFRLVVIAVLCLAGGRSTASQALSQATSTDESESDQILLDALSAKSSSSTAVRLNATTVLSHYQDREDVVSAMMALMKSDPDPWVRYSLAQSIDATVLPGRLAEVIENLEHRDPILRSATLGYLRWAALEPRLEARLVSLLQSEEFWWIRARALEALAGGHTDDSMHALLDGLLDRSNTVFEAAIRSIGERRDPRGVGPLLDVADRARGLQLEAWPTALGLLGDATAIEAVEQSLEAREPQMRCAAVRALVALRARSSRALRSTALSDPHPCVVFEGIQALASLGIGEALPDMMRRVASDGRYSLVGPLAAMKGGDAVEVCASLAMAEMDNRERDRLENVCRQLAQASRGWVDQERSTGCLIEKEDLNGVDARSVLAREALAWSPVPGEDRGGTSRLVAEETKVLVKAAMNDGKETWLLVFEPGRIDAWMRETDLREGDEE